MITVRFPSGFSVQYNTATYSQTSDSEGITRLYTKKGGGLIAYAPMRDCIVEWVQPCRTYSAVRDETISELAGIVTQMQLESKTIQRQIRNLKVKTQKRIKGKA
jgi:hypothetical protein